MRFLDTWLGPIIAIVGLIAAWTFISAFFITQIVSEFNYHHWISFLLMIIVWILVSLWTFFDAILPIWKAARS